MRGVRFGERKMPSRWVSSCHGFQRMVFTVISAAFETAGTESLCLSLICYMIIIYNIQ